MPGELMRIFVMGLLLLLYFVALPGCRMVGNYENADNHFAANEGANFSWGSAGSDTGQFDEPSGLAVDSGGNVYVVDENNHRIQKFTAAGVFITQWGAYGSGEGQFDEPSGVAVDSGGNVYVADENNNRIQKFTATGVFVTQWGVYGSGDGQFDEPSGVAVDSVGNVYVADEGNDRVQKFTPAGVFLGK